MDKTMREQTVAAMNALRGTAIDGRLVRLLPPNWVLPVVQGRLDAARERERSDLVRYERAIIAAERALAERDAAVARSETAEAAIRRVRALHTEHLPDPYVTGVGRCRTCRSTWPCSTIRALDGGGTDA